MPYALIQATFLVTQSKQTRRSSTSTNPTSKTKSTGNQFSVLQDEMFDEDRQGSERSKSPSTSSREPVEETSAHTIPRGSLSLCNAVDLQTEASPVTPVPDSSSAQSDSARTHGVPSIDMMTGTTTIARKVSLRGMCLEAVP